MRMFVTVLVRGERESRDTCDTLTPASRELFLTSSRGIVRAVCMAHPAHKYSKCNHRATRRNIQIFSVEKFLS